MRTVRERQHTRQPLSVPELTAEVAGQVINIARALPYRSQLGVDPERVVWVETQGSERVGVAWAPHDPDGPHWMIAITRTDGRAVRSRRIRDIVDLIAGNGVPYEQAPNVAGASQITLLRARAS